MSYILHDLCLGGQFASVEDFFESLRNYTFPILNKIKDKNENIIWKKDTFWQSEICKGVCLTNIPKKRNERSSEIAQLQMQLMKIAYEEPFYGADSASDLKVKEYQFDEEYREYFEERNCFTNAIENEGIIISFIHPAYSCMKLPLCVEYNDTESTYNIDNIYSLEWWKREPEIKTWRIGRKYLVEVRANEFEYHPPHFHVSCNEFSAVFKMSDGNLYKDGKKKWTYQMVTEIKDWYETNKEELQEAWKNLHSSCF